MDKDLKATRVNQTYTHLWEKRVLPRMAEALPAWVSPDILTVLGLFASVVIFLGLILLRSSRWWILMSDAGFVLYWWADSLDGTLARVRHREREKYGYFVDHISDAFSVVLICTGLGLSSLVHPGVGLALAIGYLLMNVFTHILAYVDRVFLISYGRMGPTEVRIAFVFVTTLFAFKNPVLFRLGRTAFSLADTIILAMAVTLMILFIVSSIRKGIQLDRLDRRPNWKAQDPQPRP